MSWSQMLPQRYRVASNPLHTERRLELLVLVMALVVALLLVYGGLRLAMLGAPATVLPAADSLQVGNVMPRFRPQAGDSEEIRSRPLFWAGRRPEAAVEPAPDEEQADAKLKELKGVKLVGVFGSGDAAGIIVQTKKGKRRLMVGDEVDGWELKTVTPNEVTFAARGETRTLMLKQQAIAERIEPAAEAADAAAANNAAEAPKPPARKSAAAKKPARNRAASDSLSLGGSRYRPGQPKHD